MDNDWRGLVISPPLIWLGPNSIKFTDADCLDPRELRAALLFWDRLDYPQNMVMNVADGDVEFLASAGVLQRTMVDLQGVSEMAMALPLAHVIGFKSLEAVEPGRWSMSSMGDSVHFRANEVGDRGVVVQLHNAIPVPDVDVPLQDILEFRQKRRSEMLALRHHLERIYQRIIAAGDGPLAIQTELGALQLAIADHIKATREARFPTIGVNLEGGLNLSGTVTAAFLAHEFGLDLITTTLSAAAAAVLTIKAGLSLKWKKPSPTPFRYVSTFNRELFNRL